MGKPDYILLIDDDEMANYLNVLMLQSGNAAEEIFVVENANDAFSFIKKLEEKAASKEINICILLDLDMPTLDGYEFLEVLKEDKPNIKIQVYILSILSKSKEKKRFTKYPIVKFIEKPLRDHDVNFILSNSEPVYFNQTWATDFH